MATLYKKVKLLQGLLNGEEAQTSPFFVAVDLTRRCNLRCPCCPYHSPLVKLPSRGDPSIQDLSPEIFQRFCADLKVMGPTTLIFVSQGESFLHHHLFDFIALAKEVGLRVEMFTNGILLDANRIELLIDSALDVLKVSLWATSPEEYVRNYPGTDPENFHRVVAGLKLLAETKARKQSLLPRVELHYPIIHNNYPGIAALPGLAQATGCQAVFFSALHTDRQVFDFAALTGEEEEWVSRTLVGLKKKLRSLPLKHNIHEILRRYAYGEAVWEKVPCYMSWLHVHLLVDGTVLPCRSCDLPAGNLNRESFRDIWNGEALRRFRRQTLTREGLRDMASHCDCGRCVHLENNVQVHQVFKWFSPFVRP
jgi:MoaA/NifB/PqqE/SkfB family radical SAM enzyme